MIPFSCLSPTNFVTDLRSPATYSKTGIGLVPTPSGGGYRRAPQMNDNAMHIAFAGFAASLCFLLFDLVSENHG
jgi:hypothetical protein